MKQFLSLIFIVLALFSCAGKKENLNELVEQGEFSKALRIIDKNLQGDSDLSLIEQERLQKIKGDINAVLEEYRLSYNDVFQSLREEIADLTDADIKRWESDYSLEYYIIEGKKLYYNNCIFDLFQVNKEASKRAGKIHGSGHDASEYPLETIKAFESDSVFSAEIRIALRYFQNLDSIPPGSRFKAWIPYIRNNKIQQDIRILHSNIEDLNIPDKDVLSPMIYFEHIKSDYYNSASEWEKYFSNPVYSWITEMKKPSFVNDSTLLLHFVFQYRSYAIYNIIKADSVFNYNKTSDNYLRYTMETVGNQFTPYLKELSSEIIGNETNKYLKAKRIYSWICKNIIWTDPKPVLGDYAEYTAKYLRGDCAAKSNLFISLCRINGIPAREQGGWTVFPGGNHSQHSWSQVYFEPYGWLPVDVTIGSHLITKKDEALKYFYFGNISPYHMIIYDNNPTLFPPKKHQCLYGGGIQLGAFEWEGGDLEPYIKFDSYIVDY